MAARSHFPVTPRSPYNYPLPQATAQSAQQFGSQISDALRNMEKGPDGRYYGPRVIERAQPSTSQASVSGYYTTRVFPQSTAFPQPTTTYSSSRPLTAAQALDGADGVMDGRYFGMPIGERISTVLTPGVGFAPPPRRYSLATYTEPAPTPLASTTAPRRYSLPAQLMTSATFGPRSAVATALDAADGVFDGQYFGHPIIERSPFPVTSYPMAPTFTAPPNFGSAYEATAPVRRLSLGPSTLPAGGFAGFPTPPTALGFLPPVNDEMTAWAAQASAAGLSYPPTVIYQVTPIVEVIPTRCSPPVQRVCPPCYPSFTPMAVPMAGAAPYTYAAPPTFLPYAAQYGATPTPDYATQSSTDHL